MAITLFKDAQTGMVFRPEDFNGNMTAIETAVNQLETAAEAIPDPSVISNKANLVDGKVPFDELPTVLGTVSSINTRTEDLEALLTTTSDTLDSDGTNADSGSVSLMKSGKSITANINIGSTTGIGTSLVTIAETILTNFRPTADIIVPAMFFAGSVDVAAMAIGIVKITTDGHIQAAVDDSTNNKLVVCHVCWKQ